MSEDHSTTTTLQALVARDGWVRRNWKVIASAAVTAVLTSGGWLAAKSFDAGMQRSQGAALAEKVETLTNKVDALNSKLDEFALGQAEMKGKLSSLNAQSAENAKFKEDVIQGIKDALAHPVPKLTGHRAH